MSGTRTPKKLTVKSQRKAIVNFFCGSGTDRLVNNKWITDNQFSRYINNAITLAGSDDALTLAGAALPLAGGIQINCKNQHRVIHLDLTRHFSDALPLA